MYNNHGQLPSQVSVRVMVDIVIWFAVAVPVLLLFIQGKPYERGFFCEDQSLSLPYKPETLSTSSLLVAGVVVSFLVIILTEVLSCLNAKCHTRCLTRERLIYSIKCYAVFLTGFILQQAIEKVVKNRTGILRPNFFDVCKPRPFGTGSGSISYITNYTCAGSDHKEIRESRLSFPSGHSSLALYIAVYFS
ncbi:putative phosphatidate phosphatase, partial [Ruditapes philippinarum]|uniref:putative phosphatidate phosphatase n=1 Tax=Ruditapes philippinarum TaxID=129788 RepID=UPI00295AFF11